MAAILRSDQTVFSVKDIQMLWGESCSPAARVRLNYYVRHEELYRIRRGLYAKDRDYDRFELATKICTPSYIGFETVLQKAGMNFQFYSSIFVASYLAREINVDGQNYCFKKIKRSVLANSTGIDQTGKYPIATAERAFLDAIYLYKNYHFDNLSLLDWGRVFEILPIYNNKRMGKTVQKYYKNYKK